MATEPKSEGCPPTLSPYILPLHAVTRRDAGHAGTKAAYLGALAQAGFPVPDGFVLTLAAWERVVAFSGLAVPSSSVAEDLPDASFAGQYETVLDVYGPDDLLAAVQRCWSAAQAAHATAYAHTLLPAGAQTAPGHALLVQRLISAKTAGVAFTANPLSGDRSEVLVSAVRGRGERLVSGRASPDEWLVSGNTARCLQARENAIDGTLACDVASLARGVEAHFGSPQDLEWALAGAHLYLLQARPITALPRHGHTVSGRGHHRKGTGRPPRGFWQREASHYPQPLSPMTRSTLLRSQNAGLRRVFRDLSLPMDGLELREIGGWVYLRRVWLGDGPLPPAWLMPLLIRCLPPVRSRVATCVRAMRQDRAGAYLQRWETRWRGELVTRMSALRSIHLVPLADGALDAHLGNLLTLITDATIVIVQVAARSTVYSMEAHMQHSLCDAHLTGGYATLASSRVLVPGGSCNGTGPGRAPAHSHPSGRQYPDLPLHRCGRQHRSLGATRSAHATGCRPA
jgi:pyruvate,water dikinase